MNRTSATPSGWRRPGLAALAVALSIVLGPGSALAATGTYRNPILPDIPGNGVVESCADPSVIEGQEGEGLWYMYCTTDPLNDEDRTNGNFNFHLVPMFSSSDLVNWTYLGDAFSTRPAYATGNAGLWAPEIEYYPESGKYHLYYTVTDTTLPGGGSAIGVATSQEADGPWVHQGSPVVEPHAADCCPGSRRWVFDPEIERTAGPDYIYYGSYFGGISVRELSEDPLTRGLTSDPGTQQLVAIPNRYEGAEVVVKDGFYYLFASATNCCNGPLTGYSVFVGRSRSPVGPFVDQEGVSFLAGRVGGTVSLSFNGNRWVGPGHNTVLVDYDDQWWTIYHAVDMNDPYFEGAVGFTKRPAMLDAIDWVGGWPVVNGGRFISDTPQPAPAAQPGQTTNHKFAAPDRHTPGKLLFADEFNDTTLSSAWSWVRQPAAGTYGEAGGTFRFNTRESDLFVNRNDASVLVTDAPDRNFLVEAKVALNLPREGCCQNFVQSGVVLYKNDNNYLKHVHVSIFETRQTEWAKELFPVPAGYPRYGNTVVGPPGDWTYFRIAAQLRDDAPDLFTAYTSRNGVSWRRGGTWTHELGADMKIGLVSMGGSGFVANFDYVRVYGLNRGR